MKRLLLIVLPLLLIVGCSKPINESSLIDRSGVKYQQDSEKPYSGEVFRLYDTGEKLYQGTYENGLLLNYSYLNKDGSVKEPVNRGTLIDRSGLMYSPDSDEPFTGKVFKNYSTGEKLYQGTYENGLLIDYSYLNEDGSVKEPVNRGTLIDRSGLMYSPDSDKPYTGEVFELYENGQKKYEGTYKDGKKYGLQTSWYENGLISNKIHYLEDKVDCSFETYNTDLVIDRIKEGLKRWGDNMLLNEGRVSYPDNPFDVFNNSLECYEKDNNGPKKEGSWWYDGRILNGSKNKWSYNRFDGTISRIIN